MLPFALCLAFTVSVARSQSGAVVVYEFENRCDVDAPFDLTHAIVTGRTANGDDLTLTVDEPEWRYFSATTVDARTEGREAVHYAAKTAISRVCIDLSRVAAATPVCLDAGSSPVAETKLPFGQAWSSPGPVNPSCDVYTSYASIQTRDLRLEGAGIGSFSAKALGSRISAVTVGLHPMLHINPFLYAGVDGAMGLGNAGETVLGASPPVTTRGPALHVHFGGVVGVTSPRLGPFEVRGEVFGGGRAYLVAVDAPCPSGGCPVLSGAAWMVQPKAIVEAWLTPFMTVGAFGGADVVHPGDWATGIFIGFHEHGNDAGR